MPITSLRYRRADELVEEGALRPLLDWVLNGADLRNVCTEVGMSAIRAERDYVIHGDFMKAVKKLNEAKQLESSARYNADGNLQAVCRSISELVLRKPKERGFAFKFNCSDFKIDANGANVAVNIRVIGEFEKQARFSNGGVTDNKKLKQVIVFIAHDVFFSAFNSTTSSSLHGIKKQNLLSLIQVQPHHCYTMNPFRCFG
ncbi:hypothetical protein KIW84_070656 [Lathyrus oleraceus]|uniref:AAA ATPase AAA+ lid domain-containing protein n=1 Tax=Pisum sativum TaxID=3888 RepID=A0A9D4VHB4_PEA|nr:hypothetical protein KIW84_070656 [Pisum sativum]